MTRPQIENRAREFVNFVLRHTWPERADAHGAKAVHSIIKHHPFAKEFAPEGTMLEDELEAASHNMAYGGGRPPITVEEAQASIAISLKRIADVICTPPPYIVGDNIDIAALKDTLKKSGAGGIFVESRIGRKTMEITFETASVPEPTIALGDAAPGLYLFGGTLIMKTEYRTEQKNQNAYSVDAYIVESGEYFWGGTKGIARDQCALKVTPVKVNLP